MLHRVKIKLCEPAAKIRKPKNSRERDDEHINKISKFKDDIVSTIKNNCTRLKVQRPPCSTITLKLLFDRYFFFLLLQRQVLPVLKKKSRTALNKVKSGYRNLSESQFFLRKKNCDLDGCGSGMDDCTSRTSASSRKSLTSIASDTERKRKKAAKATESTKGLLSDCGELQICECDDNPNKSSNEKAYSICCCTKEDSSGNKIKKGSFPSQQLFNDETTVNLTSSV